MKGFLKDFKKQFLKNIQKLSWKLIRVEIVKRISIGIIKRFPGVFKRVHGGVTERYCVIISEGMPEGNYEGILGAVSAEAIKEITFPRKR